MNPPPFLQALPAEAALAAGAYAWGAALWRGGTEEEPESRFAVRSGLGLFAFAGATYALGAAGLLRAPILWALALAPLVFARRHFAFRMPRFAPGGAAFAAASAALFLASQSPLIGGDALCYHLHLAKQAVLDGRIGRIPYHDNADWPFIFESLFAAGYAMGGESAAKFVHAYAAVLTGLSLAGFCRRRAWGVSPWVPALLYLLAPLTANLAGVAYVDLGLALFSWLALERLLRAFESGRAGEAAAGGAFLGAALGVKFLAGFAAVGCLASALPGAGIRARARALAAFGAVAALAAAFWYAKLWVLYGNPVYPYFPGIFGGGADPLAHHAMAISRTARGFVEMPFLVTYAPQAVTGFSEQIGPAFLALAPLAALSTARLTAARLGAFSIVYLVLWTAFYQNLRFLAPVLPALAALSALGISASAQMGPLARRAALGFTGAVLAAQAALLLFHYRAEWPAALGAESRASYLAKHDRVNAVARRLNAEVGRDATLFMPDEIDFYPFDQRIVRGNVMMQRHPEAFATAAAGLRRLREEGITHLLLAGRSRHPFVKGLYEASPAALASQGLAVEETPATSGYLLLRLDGTR